MTVLETERLRIRPWRTGPDHDGSDRAALDRMAADPDMMRYVSGGKPWSAERLDGFLARQAGFVAEYGLAFGAVERIDEDGVIGLCGLQPLNAGDLAGEFELGWWIWKDHWGRGYASEAARAVLDHARDPMGLERLVAVIDPPNAASIRVAEKLGMRFERTLPASATRTERDDKIIALYGVRFTG